MGTQHRYTSKLLKKYKHGIRVTVFKLNLTNQQ